MGDIISASRRTDLPAFYSEWLMNRLRAGFCLVPNPMNPGQVPRISLSPPEVEAIVFWTKDPRPLLQHLPEIEAMGHRYYFQFTLNAYPRELEPHAPSMQEAVDAFARLSAIVGPHRCLWRYDPIILTSLTDIDYHRARLDHLCAQLSGLTGRVTVSVVDFYRKAEKRWQQEQQGLQEQQRQRMETLRQKQGQELQQKNAKATAEQLKQKHNAELKAE
jgi:DNA repair photolyase